jgi:hypothetical protein
VDNECPDPQAPVCGDGVTESPETCDDGVNNGQPGYCNTTCDGTIPAPYCGDGNVDAGETCDDGVNNGQPGYCNATCDGTIPPTASDAGFLIIDEDSIDNGIGPNFFSDSDVNEANADVGVRDQLPWFANPINQGTTIDLYTGQMGDEGWYALKTIPDNWSNAVNPDGLRNYVSANSPIGTSEDRLDKIDDVTPLRAEGLNNLLGETVCAVVYDSDISINYDDPINGSLKGENLGIVAFDVLSITERSQSDLPMMKVKVLDADAVCAGPLFLFTDADAPVLVSSSEHWDVVPDGQSPDA